MVEGVAYPWPSIGDRTEAILDRMMENRRPSPDYDVRGEEDRESLKDLIKQTLRASVEIHGGYNEGGGGSWKDKIIWVMGSLAVSGVIGAVLMYGKMSAFEVKLDSLQAQMTEVKQIIKRSVP